MRHALLCTSPGVLVYDRGKGLTEMLRGSESRLSILVHMSRIQCADLPPTENYIYLGLRCCTNHSTNLGRTFTTSIRHSHSFFRRASFQQLKSKHGQSQREVDEQHGSIATT